MPTPDISFYRVLGSVLTLLIGPSTHLSTLRSVISLVWALLCSQSLHVSDLGRALPDPQANGARQQMRRVRRILGSTSLSSQSLTPVLIRLALFIVQDPVVTVVLDSTRCVRWEVFTIGVAFRGRVLPISWAVIPYPWPKGTYTPTVIGLIERTLGLWPEERALHLVADRGFPSLLLFSLFDRLRKRLQLDYTIRLRAGDYVRLSDGQTTRLAELMLAVVPESWRVIPASYQKRKKVGPSAFLVIGRSEVLPPAHQRGAADAARRRRRAQRRAAHLLSKHQKLALQTDGVWALLSTIGDVESARRFYERRFHTEGTYRDLKTWHLEAVASHESDEPHLLGTIGLAVLAYLIQAIVGAMAGCSASQREQARQRQWSTTDRLSIFWRGRQVLHDYAFDWKPWLQITFDSLQQQLSRTLLPSSQPHPRRRTTSQQSHPPIKAPIKEAV